MRRSEFVRYAAALPVVLANLPSVAAAGEAPSLAQAVRDRRLPPLAERLPARPMVVPPHREVGRYGGTWRTAINERTDSWMIRCIGFDGLVQWAEDWNGVVPNVAESVAVEQEGRVFLVKLRAGMRWSDGHPFTADDLVFAVNEVFALRELGGHPTYMVTSEGPGRIEKLDATTVRFVFPAPNGQFLQKQCIVDQINAGHALVKYPAHYMRRFHKAHNPDADRLAREAGFESWDRLFQARASWYENPEKPSLNAWVVTTPYGRGQQVVAARNPYYWKVDTAGNQLPYIDRVTFDVFRDAQVLLLKIMAGEVDFHGRHVNEVANLAVLRENRARGRYRIMDQVPSDASDCALPFNQTHRDPARRRILTDRRLRVALSHAINRQEIIDLVWVGTATAIQVAVRPDYPPLYNEQLAMQHTQHDVALANRLLDEAGYNRRNAAGIRLDSAGQPVVLTLLTRTDKRDMIDVAEMVVRYWRAVGIDTRLDVAERSLVRARRRAGDYDISLEDYAGGTRDAMVRNDMYVPVDEESLFGLRWVNWYLNVEDAEEPPAEIRRQLALYDRFRGTVDEAEQLRLYREILQITADQFHTLGIGSSNISYAIVGNRMRNVPERMFGSYAYAGPAPLTPAQFWIADGR